MQGIYDPKDEYRVLGKKVERNQERDQEVWRKLEAKGWSVEIVWECKLVKAKFADTVESRFKELHEVYVPLSMALLTRYDEAYLGIGPAKREE